MSFESTPQNKAETAQERLNSDLGIVFCTEKKDGGHTTLEDQIEEAENLNLPAVQFDFRKRTYEELLATQERLETYREANPRSYLSIHGETPKISKENVAIENHDRIVQELRIAKTLGSESYTVHPPRVNIEIWKSLTDAVREQILENYSSMFVEEIVSVALEENFGVAIENMPTKGEEGVFGQTTEEIGSLVGRLENALVIKGIDAETAQKRIGITLDVNHALHGVAADRWEEELTRWFEEFGERIKIVHIYTPSNAGDEFKRKYQVTLDLAALHSPNTKIFLESKQESGTTATAYAAVRSGPAS